MASNHNYSLLCPMPNLLVAHQSHPYTLVDSHLKTLISVIRAGKQCKISNAAPIISATIETYPSMYDRSEKSFLHVGKINIIGQSFRHLNMSQYVQHLSAMKCTDQSRLIEYHLHQEGRTYLSSTPITGHRLLEATTIRLQLMVNHE